MPGSQEGLRVREEASGDVERTFHVVRSAFGSRLEADLVDALRRSARPQVSLVAERDGEVVGHVFFSPVTLEAGPAAPPLAQLSPVAVLPEHQRRGVGTALIRAGLTRCGEVGWSAVFVIGSPVYYVRFGFEPAGPRGFSYPGPHDPYLQVLEIAPGCLSGAGGRIALHPAFAEVGAD